MIKSYSRFVFNFTRKTLICLALIGIGYLLGNAFPTFEVVPYGYKAGRFNPVGLAPFVEMKDFDDTMKGSENE